MSLRRSLVGPLCAVLVSCSSSGSASEPSSTVPATNQSRSGRVLGIRAFEQFDDCDALMEHLRTITLERVGPYGLNGGGMVLMGGREVMPTAASEMASTTVGAASPSARSDSSSTNTQEVGVDEGDVAENDGRYVYTITPANSLRIVDIETARQTASVPLESFGQHQMVLDGDRLVIVTSAGWWRGEPGPMVDSGVSSMPTRESGGRPSSTVMVVDVSNRLVPKVNRTATIDGTVAAVRASGGVLRVVMTSSLGDRLDFVQPARPGNDAEAKAKRLNIETIRSATKDQWLPRIATSSKASSSGEPRPALECSRIGRPAEFAGLGLTWVASIDLASGDDVVGSAGVVAEGALVYASESSLYVSTTRWAGADDADVRPVRPEPAHTAIHQFGLDGASATYLATGRVSGTLLNQFALSEHKGVLRVAATIDGASDGRSASSSSVYTLVRKGEALSVIGEVGGLGRTERIHSVRFLGDIGYVVTFRQTDPLYVLNLSDPSAPKLTGELKIPGYSAYLHPIDDAMLLGLGQDATTAGRRLGSQLSVFDVADASAPQRIASLDLAAWGSEAENDHHAFLYWKPTRQAIIPTYSTDGRGGAVVVTVSAGGSLAEDGRVSFGDQVRRSMVVAGRLVLLGETGLGIHSLETLQRTGSVSFEA